MLSNNNVKQSDKHYNQETSLATVQSRGPKENNGASNGK